MSAGVTMKSIAEQAGVTQATTLMVEGQWNEGRTLRVLAEPTP